MIFQKSGSSERSARTLYHFLYKRGRKCMRGGGRGRGVCWERNYWRSKKWRLWNHSQKHFYCNKLKLRINLIYFRGQPWPWKVATKFLTLLPHTKWTLNVRHNGAFITKWNQRVVCRVKNQTSQNTNKSTTSDHNSLPSSPVVYYKHCQKMAKSLNDGPTHTKSNGATMNDKMLRTGQMNWLPPKNLK